MEGHGRLAAGVADLVVALSILNKDNAIFLNSNVLVTDQGVISNFAIAALLNLPLQNFHPTAISRVVMNGRFFLRAPAQEEQCIRLMICLDQIPSILDCRVRVGKLSPILRGHVDKSAARRVIRGG